MSQLISGIQQIGIGVPDAGNYFTWFRKTFGFDVKIFDDEAPATLMTRYTGGALHSRRAILTMNMNGGGGAEIWQFTTKEITYNHQALNWGDLGINAVKIKTRSIDEFQRTHKSNQVSAALKTPDGADSCWVLDELGNRFQVTTDSSWFKRNPVSCGGVCGVIIGVSDMDKSVDFYTNCLGFTKLVYDKTGTWDDLGTGDEKAQYRRVLLHFQNEFTAPFSRLLGNVKIELIQAMDRKPVRIYQDRFWGDCGFIHVCFDVPNLDLLKEQMKTHGVEFTVDSASTFDMGKSGGRFCYVEDPDGTLIEMVETHKVPILKKLNWYLNLKKRGQNKPLPNWMINLMGLSKVKD